MTTGQHLTGSIRVRKFQTMLNAKAKEEPDLRFHALADKVWRMDFLNEAWDRVYRNGGSAGVDGEDFMDIAAQGRGRVARGTVAGSEGRDLQAETGTSGSDPEETARHVPASGHSLHTGPGGADIGHARA